MHWTYLHRARHAGTARMKWRQRIGTHHGLAGEPLAESARARLDLHLPARTYRVGEATARGLPPDRRRVHLRPAGDRPARAAVVDVGNHRRGAHLLDVVLG